MPKVKLLCINMIKIIIAALVGFLSLCLVFLIPTDRMEENIKGSLKMFESQGSDYRVLPQIEGTRIDNYTDALMLCSAIYDSDENLLDKVSKVSRIDVPGFAPDKSLIKQVNKEDCEQKVETYERYWHGYLVLLKPLLYFFNYSQIKLLLGYIVFGLMGICIILASKKGYVGPAISILCGFGSLVPIAILNCMQYTSVLVIAIIGMIYIISKDELSEKQYVKFFIFIGALTSFFDFLTFPVVTLGYCLIAKIVKEKNTLKTYLCIVKDIIWYSVVWAIGYLEMWALKWVIASCITGKNIIKESILQILYRSSSATSDSGQSEYITRGLALRKNIEIYVEDFFFVVIFVLLVVVIYSLIKKVKLMNGFIFANIIISVIPFVWILILANHSYVHNWMTFRNLSIAVMAICNIIVELIAIKKTKNKDI